MDCLDRGVRSLSTIYQVTEQLDHWQWMHVFLCFVITLAVIVGSCDSISGPIALGAVPKEGTCEKPVYVEIILNIAFAFIWVSFVRFYSTRQFKFSSMLLMNLTVLSYLFALETYLPGPCSHSILHKARGGVMPNFLWSGAVIVNVDDELIPWVAGFLEAIELTFNSFSHEFMMHDLYTNETLNGTKEFNGKWELMSLPLEEAIQVSEKSQDWGETITYTKFGIVALTGGMVIFDHVMSDIQILPINEPRHLYKGNMQT